MSTARSDCHVQRRKISDTRSSSLDLAFTRLRKKVFPLNQWQDGIMAVIEQSSCSPGWGKELENQTEFRTKGPINHRRSSEFVSAPNVLSLDFLKTKEDSGDRMAGPG